ncbi:hypothetical protein KCV00_g357, partial [Aureobasidium melanogenum]
MVSFLVRFPSEDPKREQLSSDRPAHVYHSPPNGRTASFVTSSAVVFSPVPSEGPLWERADTFVANQVVKVILGREARRQRCFAALILPSLPWEQSQMGELLPPSSTVPKPKHWNMVPFSFSGSYGSPHPQKRPEKLWLYLLFSAGVSPVTLPFWLVDSLIRRVHGADEELDEFMFTMTRDAARVAYGG